MEGYRRRASSGEVLDHRPSTVPPTRRKSRLGSYFRPESPRAATTTAAAGLGDPRIARVGDTELYSSYTEHCFDEGNDASAAVAVRVLPIKEPRKPGARRLFCRSCPCSGGKSVDVEEKHIGPKSPIPSNLDLSAPLSAGTQNFSAGKAGLSSIPERAAPEEFMNQSDVEEVPKAKMTSGNGGKDRSIFNVASRFSPEKTFPAELGHQIPLTDSFSFPILNPPSTSDFTGETPRDSLDVFRPSESPSVMKKSAEFQRRAAVLQYPGEGDRSSFTHPASPKLRPEEDAASDASSDLFEIESLTTHMACRRRDSLDETEGRSFAGSGASPGVLQPRKSIEGPQAQSPVELYPPSEASSEWSIATAEGFDLPSAASSYEEFRIIEVEQGRVTAEIGGN